ncbi:MAG: hypothetical protein U0K93_00145 [Acutalibacteraceae bacterium]|nr:hypothetical protein [Acutalibacteraceae bacterium]
MAIGFRKSLFGFNQNDVVDYIEKTHIKFKTKTDELNNKLEEAKRDYDNLTKEKDEINNKLNEFIKKADEIEMLSEKIGKLYLVSQSNAQAIMTNAEENKEKAQQEVTKNLSAIDEAHVSLNELRTSIISTSENFIKEVDTLLSSLATTRDQINENIAESDNALEHFEKV